VTPTDWFCLLGHWYEVPVGLVASALLWVWFRHLLGLPLCAACYASLVGAIVSFAVLSRVSFFPRVSVLLLVVCVLTGVLAVLVEPLRRTAWCLIPVMAAAGLAYLSVRFLLSPSWH
jgi:hypothetical protein